MERGEPAREAGILQTRRGSGVRGVELPAAGSVVELDAWIADPELIGSLRACIAAQRALITDFATRFVPHPDPESEVSPERLEAMLARGEEVSGLASDPGITNVISFNLEYVADSVRNAELLALRQRADALVERKANETFAARGRIKVFCSGNFWYPPGSFMRWHTNNAAPGWRIYVTHAEEPGRSFFRYRDPDSGTIFTSPDREWHARAFPIDPGRPLWHAIRSDTHRFSFGYIVYRHRPLRALVGRIKRSFPRLRS
jgi:hypothetical protein